LDCSKNGWAVLKEFFNYYCNEAHIFFPVSQDMSAGDAGSIQVAEKRGYWKRFFFFFKIENENAFGPVIKTMRGFGI